MSYPDPPPPPPLPYMQQPPFHGSNFGGFWPQSLTNNELPDSHLQFDHGPPFKRPRNYENNPPNFAPIPPMNPRMNPLNPQVNRGTSHIFYKTRMCAKFLEGSCRNGDNCTFAHGYEDLREPPPNWQELVREKDGGAGNWNDDQRIIHRMKICKKFYNGEECPFGEKCNFLHESPSRFKTDTERLRESTATSIGAMGPVMGYRSCTDESESNKNLNGSLDAFCVDMKPAFWKTKLCSKWEATGQCHFGEKCHFAHGQSELQVPGGRIEAEMMMNIGSILTKPFSIPVNDAPPTTTVVGATTKEEGEGKKAKWKGSKKMNRIYADWIDDLIPPHMLPGNVES